MNPPKLAARRFALRTVATAATLVAPAAAAQSLPPPYIQLSDGAEYRPLAAGSSVVPSLDDSQTVQLDLPFAVTFFGAEYRSLYINANGLVSVSTSRSGFNFAAQNIPVVDLPNGYVAPLWDDWCTGTTNCAGVPNPGSGVFYSIDAAERRVTIEWRRVKHFRDDVTSSDVTFKLVWFGGPTGRFELTYGPVVPGVDAIGFPTELRPRIGFESPDGLRGAWLPPCNGSTPCSTPEAQQLTDTRVTVAADLGPDVFVADVESDQRGRPGLPLPARFRVVNAHAQSVGPLRYDVYLLPAAVTSTVGATPAFVSSSFTLPALTTRTASVSIPVLNALPEGAYTPVVVIDAGGQVVETDEGNNRAVGSTVTLAGRGPDFAATDVRPVADRVDVDAPLEVAYRIDNLGNEEGDLRAQVYLSRNPLITTADRPLGAALVGPLGPGQSRTGVVRTTIAPPLPTGRYYVGLIADVDLAVHELDETNNVRRSETPFVFVSSDLAILTESLAPGRVGVSYFAQLAAAGGRGEYAWTTAGLPIGLQSMGSTIQGVPQTAGSFSVEVTAASDGRTSQRSLNLTIQSDDLPLTVIDGPLPEGFVGQDYEASLTAIGGRPPYRWARTSGRLPESLSLDENGRVFGVLREAGGYPFEARVEDGAGQSQTLQVNLTVRPSVNLTIISAAALPVATLNAAYQEPLVATGGTPPYAWSAQTVLPPGLSVNTTGEVAGNPERVGDYTFRIQVQDAAGRTDVNGLRLQVRQDSPVSIVPDRLPAADVAAPYLAPLRVTGGRRPLTWAVTGELPVGIAATEPDPDNPAEADADLVLRGTPSTVGVWPLQIEVRDARGRQARQAYALWVRAPPPEEDSSGCRTPLGAPSGWLLLLMAVVWWTRRRSAV